MTGKQKNDNTLKNSYKGKKLNKRGDKALT